MINRSLIALNDISSSQHVYWNQCQTKSLWLRAAKVQNNMKFLKNEGEMCFFIDSVHLCHFVTLWDTSSFSHLPQKPCISSLTFLVSLSCQLIFLSPHAPFSPISSFLISPYAALFSLFYCLLCIYFSRTDVWNPGTTEFYIFHGLQFCFDSSVFFSCLLHFCGLHPFFCFSFTQLEIKPDTMDKETPLVSIMSFCVVA